jgi:cytochrome c biogenesis protein CcmG/thiol:disulfide interchange protein DsbE
MWRYIVPIAVFVTLLGFFYFGLGRDQQTLPSPLIGKPAPVFSLPTVEDPTKIVSNEEFAGRPYLLNVWGTWCPECRYEHDVLLEIQRRQDVAIIGFDWKDELDAAQRWLTQLGNPYTVTVFDAEGRAAIDWGVYGAPESFLVDARGIIVEKHVGALTMQIWENKFLPKLKETRE